MRYLCIMCACAHCAPKKLNNTIIIEHTHHLRMKKIVKYAGLLTAILGMMALAASCNPEPDATDLEFSYTSFQTGEGSNGYISVYLMKWYTVNRSRDLVLVFVVLARLLVTVLKLFVNLTLFCVKNLKRTVLKVKYGKISPLFRILSQ